MPLKSKCILNSLPKNNKYVCFTRSNVSARVTNLSINYTGGVQVLLEVKSSFNVFMIVFFLWTKIRTTHVKFIDIVSVIRLLLLA